MFLDSSTLLAALRKLACDAPQGDRVSLQVRTGFVLGARFDARMNLRYSVTRDGQSKQGIDAVYCAIGAEQAVQDIQAAQEREQVAALAALRAAQERAAFYGLSDESIAQIKDPLALTLAAGIAQLFLTGTITPQGAREALQAAGMAHADAQAEVDYLTDGLQTLQGPEWVVDLSDGLRDVGMTVVRAHCSMEARAYAECGNPGTIATRVTRAGDAA